MARETNSAFRREKINAQLHHELALAMAQDVKDPRLSLVTVIAVTCAPDLSMARVRVSVLGEKRQQEVAVVTLRGMEGYLRHLLGERLSHLRRVPRLDFRLDESIAYGVRVSSILRELAPEGNAGTVETGDE